MIACRILWAGGGAPALRERRRPASAPNGTSRRQPLVGPGRAGRDAPSGPSSRYRWRPKIQTRYRRAGRPDAVLSSPTPPSLAHRLGAQEKTRTSTGFPPQVPETCASTNSATWAPPRDRLSRQTCQQVAVFGQRQLGFVKESYLLGVIINAQWYYGNLHTGDFHWRCA